MTGPYRFGDWCFQPELHRLTRGDQQLDLEPKVARLLGYFLSHPGELISRDRLVESVWEGQVVSDEAVRRAIYLLRQALSVEGQPPCIRTVHKKGYIAEFPSAVTGASDVTPSSAATSPEVAPSLPPGLASRRARPVVLLLGGALVAASAWGLSQLFWPQSAAPGAVTTAPQRTLAALPLAVLPFADFSDEPDSGYLVEGFGEELLELLARNPALQVTARRSAFRFTGEHRNLADIAQQLGVRYVVTGSLRKLGERVRITLQLQDTLRDIQLWSAHYDRPQADLFGVQQEIADQVARQLQAGKSGPRATIPAGGSAEAHLEYLKARQLMSSWTVADAETAARHLQRAIELAPDYAAAYVQLAETINIRYTALARQSEGHKIAAPLIEKALSLDPDLGEAWVIRGELATSREATERDIRHGLSLSPSFARGYETLASSYGPLPERNAEALRLIEQAIALDPLAPRSHYIKALIQLLDPERPDYTGAEKSLRHTLTLDEKHRGTHMRLGIIKAMRGDFAGAVADGERAQALDPEAVWVRNTRVWLHLDQNDLAAAARVNNAGPAGRMSLHLARGETAAAAQAAMELDSTAFTIVSAAATVSALQGAGADLTPEQQRDKLKQLLGAREKMPEHLRWSSLPAFAYLAVLMRQTGEIDAGVALASAVQQRIRRIAALSVAGNEGRFNDAALSAAILGDHERALALLDTSVASRVVTGWWLLKHAPAYAPLRNLPRFQRLLANADAKRQR